MRKKLFLFLLIISCIIFGGISTTVSLYADENSITTLTSTVYLGSGEAPKEDNVYIAEFKEQAQPYDDLTYRLTISTSGIDFSDLLPTEKEELISQLVWDINGTTITFDESQKSQNAENISITLHTSRTGVDTLVQISKPGLYTISVSTGESENIFTQQTIKAKYAPANKLKLLLDYNNTPVPTNNEIQINYDLFEPAVLSAKFDIPDFVDPALDLVYEWTANNAVIQDQKTANYQITSVSIGTTTIICAIPSMGIEARVSLIVSSEQDITLTVTPSGGELEQTLGESSSQPITFTASVPIVEAYTVEWYLKAPKSTTYKKMQTSGKAFTFLPIEYSVAGEYKLFAQAILPDEVIESQTFTIKLNAKDILTTELFNIICETYSNTETGLEAYKLSIELDEAYDANRIVWYIGSAETKATAMKIGKSYDFSPQVAIDYIVTVKLLNKEGTRVEQTISNSLPLSPKPVQSSNILMYCLIAVGALIVLCIASILISNKGREKIW